MNILRVGSPNTLTGALVRAEEWRMKVVKPPEIAGQFLTRYKMWEGGEHYDSMFTDEQTAAMFNSIVQSPNEMLEFFNQVQTLIIGQIGIERGTDNHLEIAKVVVQWSNAINSFLLPLIALLAKSPEERKAQIEEFEKNRALRDAEANNITSDDFRLPDIGGLVKDDEDPPIH